MFKVLFWFSFNKFIKDANDTNLSEWSVRMQNQHIPSMMLSSGADVAPDDDDNGRVSVYFKTKSQEMGNLLGGNSEARVILV